MWHLTHLCSNILNCVNYDIIGRKTIESLMKINQGFYYFLFFFIKPWFIFIRDDLVKRPVMRDSVWLRCSQKARGINRDVSYFQLPLQRSADQRWQTLLW